MRRRFAALALAALVTFAPAALAQLHAPESLARDFRLEWQVTRGPKGTAVDGYVYNHAKRIAEHMRLAIDALDASGDVIGTSTVWVAGEVPMDNRAYFHASVPDAAAYRVRVLSVDWVIDPGGGGM